MPASLFAESQSGKSTTTAAVADGHEIIPSSKAGGGIRTSAVPVTIRSDEFASQVVINLYPAEILSLKAMEGVKSSLNDKEIIYNINNGTDQKILWDAAIREIEEYRKTPLEYDKDHRLDKLKTALLLLKFYNGEKYKALVNGEYKTIKDIQPFLAFYQDQEDRWLNLRKFGVYIFNKTDKKVSLCLMNSAAFMSLLIILLSLFTRKTILICCGQSGTQVWPQKFALL